MVAHEETNLHSLVDGIEILGLRITSKGPLFDFRLDD